MQLILVAIVILWPQSVTYWIGHGPGAPPQEIKIEIKPPSYEKPGATQGPKF
jgi:hypothetical protein